MTNWSEHDAALRRRGSLTVWFSDGAIKGWKAAARRTPGGQARWKGVIGQALCFHTDEAQATEVAIAVAVLNRMVNLGRPNSVRVA